MKLVHALIPVALLSLSGCVVGPDYKAPEAALPVRFSEGKAGTGVDTANSAWWKAFRDRKLDSLVERGKSENLTVMQALARIEEAQANIVVAGAGGLPSLSSQSSAEVSGQEVIGPGGQSTERKQASSALSASWLLDLFGQYRRAKESADASLDAAYDNVGVARLAYLSDLVSSYIDARFYQASIALQRQNLASRRETLKLTNDIRSAGAASSLDVVQAEGLVNATLAELPALETGFHVAANHIATLLGQPAASLTGELIGGAPQPSPRFDTKVGVPADLLRNRPDVRAAERQLAAATAAIGVAESQLYPSLQLSGNVSLSRVVTSAVTGTGSLSAWSFGPTINLPIFNGGALKARVTIAESQAQQAYLNWKSTVLKAVEETENAMIALRRDRQTVEALRKVVASYEQALNLARESYRGGASSILDVLDAERSLASGRLQLASGIRQLARDYVALNIATGGGSSIEDLVDAAGKPQVVAKATN